MRRIMYYQPHIFRLIQREAPSSSGANSSSSLIMSYRLTVPRRFYTRVMLKLESMHVLKVSIKIHKCLMPLLTSMLVHPGYNISIIAYGQTGSGKTYTVFGPGLLFTMNEADFGLVPRAVRHIFYKKKVIFLFPDK